MCKVDLNGCCSSHGQSVPGLIWHMRMFSSSLSEPEACLFAKTGCVCDVMKDISVLSLGYQSVLIVVS